MRSAPWLTDPATRAVLAALAAHGHEGRIVGGAVRNTLLGLPAADVDIATPALPEEVIRAVEAAGLEAVPTGIEHGTVTVVASHRPIEVTTLRRDVATDGRRATVAFTSDWAEDARRRDFTINALYCDEAGRLHDPVGGYPDLISRRVRFIGNAGNRIAEDYLRILRFFRFHASYAEGPPDADGMAACARGLGGLSRLSAERVRAEMVRLLVAPRAAAAIEAMGDIGLLVPVLGLAPRPGVFARVVAAEAAVGIEPDAMLRLSALGLAVAEDIPRLAGRMRLSRAEQRALLVFDLALADDLDARDERRARSIVYRFGKLDALRRAAALLAIRPGATLAARLVQRTSETWEPPRFPVAGADLIAAGVEAGPRVGRILAALEAWWIDQDFPDAASVQAQLCLMVAKEVPPA